MKNRWLFAGLLLICAVSHAHAPLEISLANGSAAEKAAKTQLERVLAAYDAAPWIYTRSIVVDQDAIPHSHPVLTLHTRHLKDDELLLSTFVHEQLHWYLAQNQTKADAAVGELKAMFPDVPIGHPQGSSDAEGNYYHILVIFLENRANRDLLGELRAKQVMAFWADDHYTWIYRTVMQRERDIGRILRKHDLIPDVRR